VTDEIIWHEIVVAVVVAVPPTVAASAALVQAYKTHKAVNSRITQLLELTKEAATHAATLAEKNAEALRKIAPSSEDK